MRQTTDRTLVIIGDELMRRVDNYRGDLTRADFVSRCIAACTREKLDTLRTGRTSRFASEPPKRNVRSPLIVDRELAEFIDANRGRMDRAEFIESCINACLDATRQDETRQPQSENMLPREPAGGRYASEEDFQEFKHSIRSFMRTFLDFFGDRLRHPSYELRNFYDMVDEDDPPRSRPSRRDNDDYDEYRPASRPRWREQYYPEEDDLRRKRRRMVSERYEPDDYDERYAPYRREMSYRQRADDYDETPYQRPRRRDYYPEERDYPRRPPLPREEHREEYESRRSYPPSYPPREEKRYSEPPREERRYTEPPREQPHYSASGLVQGIKQRFQQPAQQRPEPAPPAAPPVQAAEVPDPESGESGPNMYFSLWVPAILLFGFGDTLLSTMVFAKGGFEANPLMAGLVGMLGGSMMSFVMVKTAILILLAIISFKVFKHMGWLIPSILCAVGTYLVFSNLMAYMKLA